MENCEEGAEGGETELRCFRHWHQMLRFKSTARIPDRSTLLLSDGQRAMELQIVRNNPESSALASPFSMTGPAVALHGKQKDRSRASARWKFDKRLRRALSTVLALVVPPSRPGASSCLAPYVDVVNWLKRLKGTHCRNLSLSLSLSVPECLSPDQVPLRCLALPCPAFVRILASPNSTFKLATHDNLTGLNL